MFEDLAKHGAERLRQRLEEMRKGSIRAASEGAVAYVNGNGLDEFLTPAELENAFSDLPFIVVVSVSAQALEAAKFASPTKGLTPEAERYFRNKPSLTACRKYRIFGNEDDLKEKMFNYILQDEAKNDSALIEIEATLEGTGNHFLMTPWGNETHIGVTLDGRIQARQRRTRADPWQ